LYASDKLQGSILIKQYYGIYKQKGCHNSGACHFVLQWPAWAFYSADGGICVQPQHQFIAKLSGLLKVIDMAKVKQIETAVGEYDFLALASPVRYLIKQFWEREDFIC
jgi:hypothetical protein